jgi:TonB family protein
VSILQPDKAIADSTQAIALKPELAAAFKCRAFAYSQKKQFDLAIADYDQVLRISPIDRSSMMARRATYDAKGEKLKDAVDYGRMLVARLQVQKSYPRQAAREKSEGTARIFFVISREGELMSSGVGVSSGSAMLDRAALDAVQRAQPFPPLPDGSRESDEFVISLAFRISSLHQLP